jgi:hypothetical protein
MEAMNGEIGLQVRPWSASCCPKGNTDVGPWRPIEHGVHDRQSQEAAIYPLASQRGVIADGTIVLRLSRQVPATDAMAKIRTFQTQRDAAA